MLQKRVKDIMKLNDIGERNAIRRISELATGHPGILVGIGDDAAIVDGGENDWVLTSDPVIERVHFLPTTPAEDVGTKAVSRALSDLAAMGARALWLLINIVAPGDSDVARLESIFAAAEKRANEFGATIIGGDLAEGMVWEIHVFAVGQVPKGKALLRSGAKLGDQLYVTGALGGSSDGRHLKFRPRMDEGSWLLSSGWATAATDISDGLLNDLANIVDSSQVGAELELARIPVSEDIRGNDKFGSALDRALYEGEDYELLFTVSPGAIDEFERAWNAHWDLPCTRIGCMTKQTGGITGIDTDGAMMDLRRKGYEHFSREKKES